MLKTFSPIEPTNRIDTNPCDCGAKHCKNPTPHYDWCISFKKDKSSQSLIVQKLKESMNSDCMTDGEIVDLIYDICIENPDETICASTLSIITINGKNGLSNGEILDLLFEKFNIS